MRNETQRFDTIPLMRNYRRVRVKGGTFFFTLTLAERRGNPLLVRHVDALRAAFRDTLASHLVAIDAMVVLPDRLHCIWLLPEGDDGFPTRRAPDQVLFLAPNPQR